MNAPLSRGIAASARVAWEIESNWTNVPLYLLYAAVRPLSLCVLLYFLFKVVTPTPSTDPRFLAIFVGNAFFMIFSGLASGLSWAIISDREHYQIIRYVYIAPIPFVWTVIGRAMTLLAISLTSVVLTLVVGRYLLDLPLTIAGTRWTLLLLSMPLGLLATAGIGLFFAGLLLNTARHSLLLAEGVGGVLLLVCGVLYPTTYLPWWLRPVAWFNPLTHWLELSRRALGAGGFDKQLSALPDWLSLLALAILAAVSITAGWKSFLWFEHRAKRAGRIDQTTNY